MRGSAPTGTRARIRDWAHARRQQSTVSLVRGRRLIPAVRRLVKSGCLRIAVGGGDGTLNTVAGELLGHDVELVPLPMGTLNHFSRDLGIPLDPGAWDTLLTSEHTRSVDVGLAAGRLFLNNFSIGLYPTLVRERQKLAGERLLGSKQLATWWSALKLAMRNRRHQTLSVRTVDATTALTCEAALVSNNPYAPEITQPGARPHLDRGHLSLYVPRDLSPAALIRMAHAALADELDACDALEIFHAEQFTLELPRRRITVALDGELARLRVPIEASVAKGALTVVVPR